MNTDRSAVRAISRRNVLWGGLALGSLALAGCSRSETTAAEPKGQSGKVTKAMTVYRDPTCGCCEAWASIAGDNGYQVTMLEDANMAAVKQRLGVPTELASCHTAEIGGYVIEGHVPLDQVARLLHERPTHIRGIAVPGMPIGSPGMEAPDGTKQPFQVIAFSGAGAMSVYSG